MNKRTAVMLVALAVIAVAVPSEATLLTFEGVGDNVPVGAFYAGDGVTFSASAMAIVDLDAGGSGNFANEPSASTILYFPSATSTILDASMGFMTLSFYHTNRGSSGNVKVFDGVGGTGTELVSVFLPVTLGGAGDPNGGAFGVWKFTSLTLPEFGRSVVFTGTPGFIGFDNVNVGLVPEPSTVALIGLGLIGLAAAARRRRAL